MQHPSITKAELEGGGFTETIGNCFMCGLEIYKGEKHYELDHLKICINPKCKSEAAKANLSRKVLWEFVKENGYENEYIEFYFENYARRAE